MDGALRHVPFHVPAIFDGCFLSATRTATRPRLESSRFCFLIAAFACAYGSLLRFADRPLRHMAHAVSTPIGRLLSDHTGGYRELRESMNLAIVAGMALSKFPFLTLQAGALLRSLASARLSR
jgi:hypothetical protein